MYTPSISRQQANSVSNEQIYQLLLDNTKKLNALESVLQTDISSLKQDVALTQEKCSAGHLLLIDHSKNTDAKLLQLENDLQKSKSIVDQMLRDKVAGDVVMSNIPILVGESQIDLQKMFNNIADVIGFEMKNTLVAMFRLKPNTTHATVVIPRILMKFNTINAKQQFMKCYFQYGSLDLKAIGFTTPSRIYCNDSLLPCDAAIFKEALMHKKKKNIYAAKTKNGKIFVWLRSGDVPVIINSINDLHNHIASLT